MQLEPRVTIPGDGGFGTLSCKSLAVWLRRARVLANSKAANPADVAVVEDFLERAARSTRQLADVATVCERMVRLKTAAPAETSNHPWIGAVREVLDALALVPASKRPPLEDMLQSLRPAFAQAADAATRAADEYDRKSPIVRRMLQVKKA